jgi:hypothetical protein
VQHSSDLIDFGGDGFVGFVGQVAQVHSQQQEVLGFGQRSLGDVEEAGIFGVALAFGPLVNARMMS